MKILSQGPPDDELVHLLHKLDDDRIQLIVSPVNLGPGAGRRLISELVRSPLTMMLDDDMYLTKRGLGLALRALRGNEKIIAVAIPSYDINGQLLSAGGSTLRIKNGVIHIDKTQIQKAVMNSKEELVEADYLDEGAMLYRTEVPQWLFWNPQAWTLEGLDAALQIAKSGRKQAVVAGARLVHDRSWLRKEYSYYKKTRFDGLTWRRSYDLFRKRWGLRLPMVPHILYEVVYPAITIVRAYWLLTLLHKVVKLRKTKLVYDGV